MHCCNNKQLRMMSSISSSTMASLPSLAYRLRDTEDLYCDDELHPSIENDPNMRLYTEDSNTDNQDMTLVLDIQTGYLTLKMMVRLTMLVIL